MQREEERLGPQPQGGKLAALTNVILSEESVMKEVNDGLDSLYEWSGNRKMRLQLLYRGPRDGTTLHQVNSKINDKGPTFVFIKSEFGLVFGCFTSIPWTKPNHDTIWYSDKTAYIFSLSHKTRHLQYQKFDQVIEHWNEGFIFMVGKGDDFAIRDNFDNKTNNYTLFGNGNGSYKPPEGMSEEDAMKYLGGSQKFRVTDLEVYEVFFL